MTNIIDIFEEVLEVVKEVEALTPKIENAKADELIKDFKEKALKKSEALKEKIVLILKGHLEDGTKKLKEMEGLLSLDKVKKLIA